MGERNQELRRLRTPRCQPVFDRPTERIPLPDELGERLRAMRPLDTCSAISAPSPEMNRIRVFETLTLGGVQFWRHEVMHAFEKAESL